MGTSSTETVREIEELRRHLDAEIDALAEALPPKETLLTRLTLAAAGATLLLVTGWFVGHRMKVRRQEARIRRLVREAVAEARADDLRGR